MKKAPKLSTTIPSVVIREDINLIAQPTRFTMDKTSADSISSTLPYSAEYQGIMMMISCLCVRFTEPFDLYSAGNGIAVSGVVFSTPGKMPHSN